ncbi:hypothetical protein D0T84_19675 [Dysgonomonas sp. 521]|uniref:hypothetical protein n=1 Tax=Dysgonomonas sp. 521 TaxID=2302932 RepID=UPI0013D5370C|nr:hypothetical protein [Dysgonomonas sp. 521]NDV97103.1 hypothetical protein [Dysgonomonas sp. 521]
MARKNPGIKPHFFWDKQGVAAELRIDKTLTRHTIDDKKFLNFMGGCRGYVTTAGLLAVAWFWNNFDISVLLDYMGKAIYQQFVTGLGCFG